MQRIQWSPFTLRAAMAARIRYGVSLVRSLGLAITLLAMATVAQAIPFYYVGIDSLQTNATGLVGYPIDGTYSGLANPNYNRLTFLVADLPSVANAHFHGVGAYSYTGSASSPTVNDTYIFQGLELNRVPEQIFPTPVPAVSLVPGTGGNAGRFVSPQVNDVKYQDLRFQSIQALSGAAAGTTENFLFNSTSGRWNQQLTGAQVGLQLVSITDGLHIIDQAGNAILQNPGDVHPLGPGNNFSFTPTFWTEDTAAVGTYTAELRFIDQTGTFGNSGRFFMDFQVAPVPLPAAVWLFGSGLTAMVGFARRKGMCTVVDV